MKSGMLNFSLASPNPTCYGPRIGNITLKRSGGDATLQIPTPNLITTTSRGVVPHLSRDHYKLTSAIRWINVPFETFLENNPPIPTLQKGHNPLHTFLGFDPNNHILSMSARDPHDSREMPPNGHSHISVYTLRGVRKLSPTDWRSHILACQPDIIFALSDTPFTDPPHSQKRTTKSIERSSTWLSNLLHPIQGPLNIIVHMAGGTSIPARKAFAENLLERLHGPEAEAIKPLQKLDDGVVGYSFDLVPLRQSLDAQLRQTRDDSTPASHIDLLIPLLESSLAILPTTKLRLINSTKSPHEILKLVSTIRIDLFDAQWVQQAADIGVALDFQFPVSGTQTRPVEIGHNLYDSKFRLDFKPLTNTFRGAFTTDVDHLPICFCAACSPISPSTRILHGADTPPYNQLESEPQYNPPFTRAYIHHLLHTHEMSAHALLAMHNLQILSSFFAGIRQVSASSNPERWINEVDKFAEVYDGRLEVFEAARLSWEAVDLARGKGRLVREKNVQKEMV